MTIPARTSTTRDDSIAAGWTALKRGAWEEARACFTAAAGEEESAAALEGLSWAAWWLSDARVVFDARERAYRLYRSAGDHAGAARMATWLGTDHVDFRGELAVGQGWLGRARRLLEGVQPGPEHGWLCVHEAEKELLANRTARARELGAQAVDLGRELRILGLEMMGLATEGLALVTEGEVDDGMSRLDEAAAAAVGEGFADFWSVGWTCCYVIYGCERVRDYDRAAQWCRRVEEWSDRMGCDVLNRTCRAHYAGVLIWRGVWAEAEDELVGSAQHLTVTRPPMAAEATVRLGELRRRQGRLDEAAEIFEEVAEHPLALLGLGEVCMDRDEPAGARDRAEEYLRDAPPQTPTLRAAGIELLVRAAVATGDVDEAAAGAAELDAVAARVGTLPLLASAKLALGLVASATGDSDGARTAFEDATRLFHRGGAPFEAARARIELGLLLAAAGRTRDATRELRSAETSLRRIGADHEAARAGRLVDEAERAGRAAQQPLTSREREVLGLVAEGQSDREVAGTLVISEHTVHRHVANILFKLGSASRSAAVAEALKRQLI